jgi:predicted 3-demethylubiquinone-9 3-methyltransferase (glyoxalase superfamily)
LLGGGGQESRCGWLKDRFGLSWQIVPSMMGAWMTDPDPAKTKRVMGAFMDMAKLDIAKLEAAHRGD